ncbi:MAG: molybdopterin molybdotransferase MoeA [Thermoproteota archaeon]|nr:molybdopterin molybdotransferase MoeA [Thermoproteota archaeon]
MTLSSNLPYISIKKASNIIEKFVICNRMLHYETLGVCNSYARVIAQDVISSFDVPAFNCSHMDGYALHSRDISQATEKTPAVLRLAEGHIKPNRSAHRRSFLRKQQAVRIMTGGFLPHGADIVIPLEDARIDDTKSRIYVIRALPAGSFVYPRGSDIKKGQEVIKAGSILRPQDLGLLQLIHVTRVKVFKRPQVAIISTGNELTNDARYAKAGKVLDTHSGIMSKLVQELGALPFRMGIVPDDVSKIRSRIESAIAQSMDLILTLGGSSIGTYDLVETAVTSMGKPTIFFHGVKLDRGRVTGVAVIKDKPIIIMPGPIQGAINAFIVFAYPIIKLLSGHVKVKPLRVQARMVQEWNARKRFPNFTKIIYVRLSTAKNGEYEANIIGGETESLTTLTMSNGYVLADERTTLIKAGSKVKVNLLPGLSYIGDQIANP